MDCFGAMVYRVDAFLYNVDSEELICNIFIVMLFYCKHMSLLLK